MHCDDITGSVRYYASLYTCTVQGFDKLKHQHLLEPAGFQMISG